MLTTIDTDGVLRSRPMATQKTEIDGDLWFSPATKRIKPKKSKKTTASTSLAEPKRYVYVFGFGRGGNRSRPGENGRTLESGSQSLVSQRLGHAGRLPLKVNVEQAEYWDSPSRHSVHASDSSSARNGQTRRRRRKRKNQFVNNFVKNF
jgi:hypothetical protein